MLKRRTFLQQLGWSSLGAGAILYFPACQSDLPPAETGGLVSPESQGVDSQGLINFLNAANESGLEFHSIMINRNGKTLLEAWWAPFQKEYIHTLYSLSKSFTSTAIGMLQDAEKLSVEDPVVSFFPDKLPETVSDNLAAMRIHDLLTMHTGHTTDTMGPIRAGSDDWVKNFLALEVPEAPGSHFLYNTGATYMLSAIVQQVSGQKTLDYLQPKLLAPLSIVGADWEECPQGINVGGYGLRVRTQDILNFGQLYLQKGAWDGQQLVSSEWVEEATKKQVASQDNDSDWGQGYGYQFWRCKPGCYRGDGAFGQYCIVVPDKNAVIAITSETKDMGASMQLVWDHILPAMQSASALPEATDTQDQLAALATTLTLPVDTGDTNGNAQENVNGKTYTFVENDLGAQTVSFAFSGDAVQLVFKENDRTSQVKSGLHQWATSDQPKAGNSLFALPGRTPMPTKISSHYRWVDANTLRMKLKYVENVHHDIYTFTFKDDSLEMSFDNSLSFRSESGDPRPMIRAVAG